MTLDALTSLWGTYQSEVLAVGVNALLALSIYATLSCGQLSLAGAGFMAIGAYAGALLTQHAPQLPFPAVLVGAAALPALVAVPLGLPVLRLRGIFLAMATVGWGEIVRLTLVNWEYVGGAGGIIAIPDRAGPVAVYGCLVLAVFVFWRLRGSRLGYALEAIREDEPAATTMGIPATGYKLAMFCLGAALAGVAGGLQAHYSSSISPEDYDFGRVVTMLACAVMGGTRHFVGPVLGAAFITFLPDTLRETPLNPGAARLFVNGLVLLLVIVFLPNGIISLPARIRAWMGPRKAVRAPLA